MSKGRRLITVALTGTALAVACGGRLGLAQSAPPPAASAPAAAPTASVPTPAELAPDDAPTAVAPPAAATAGVAPSASAPPAPVEADPPAPAPAAPPELPGTAPPAPAPSASVPPAFPTAPAPTPSAPAPPAVAPAATPGAGAGPDTQGAGAGPDTQVLPNLTAAQATPDGSAPAAPAGAEEASRDSDVVSTQAPPAAAPPQPTPGSDQAAPAANPGGLYLIAPENLPRGPGSVGLSVQVLAPQAMNLNKEATVTIVVKNTTAGDAYGVVVRDQLPEGVHFVGSQPKPDPPEPPPPDGGLVTWNLGTLPAGSERPIKLAVVPKAKGIQEHAATVTLAAGSRAQTQVLQPVLKVEQTLNRGTVLKGQQVMFDIIVTNTGDGPARDVLIQAELSDGLAHPSLGRVLELDLKALQPRESLKLDTLVVEARTGGEQSCTVRATSPDVVGDAPEAVNKKAVTIVEPQLKLDLSGSELRYTDSDGIYTMSVANNGTAPAQDVRITATLLGDGVPYVPRDATWDAANRRLTWTIPQLEAKAPPRSYTFRVRLGGLGIFKVDGEAVARGGLRDFKSCSTSVEGNADLALDVTEDLRVLDVGQETIFRIRLRNLGTKEARQVAVKAQLSSSLEALETAGTDQNANLHRNDNAVEFPEIPRLAPGSELVLAVRAKAKAPGLATCRVFVSHQDLKNLGNAQIEDVANAKVTGPPGPASR